MFEIHAIQGYTCRNHGFGVIRCCYRATEITMTPKAGHVLAVLRRRFPVYLPTNPLRCYVDLTQGGWNTTAHFVRDEESRESLIRMTARMFDEVRQVERHLKSLTESELREVANRARARTNVYALLGKPLKRSADGEIFGRHPRIGSGPARASNLDRPFVYTDLVYRGYEYW